MEFRDGVLHPRESDSAQIKALHAAQGLGYVLPDLDHRTIFTKTILETDDRIDMAILGRMTSEAYLIVGNNFASPAEKMDAICRGADLAMLQGRIEGITDVQVWLPPQLVKSFGRRLQKMGWMKTPWDCFWRNL